MGGYFRLAIFWTCKSGESEGRSGGGGADFMVFDCTSQDPTAHGPIAYRVQKSSKTASKGAQNGSICPGNERCPVEFEIDDSPWELPSGNAG
jgi:hypothetical protein